MKIAILNISKPAFGTGDKITEYTYQLYKNLHSHSGAKIDLVYAIDDTRRNNVSGLIYTNTLFKGKITELAKSGYDIIHITNQELGFAAKLLKNSGSNAKIITTIHDTMRLRNDLHRGLKQKLYNTMTASSIKDAIDYSDMIIFDEPNTAKEIKKLYKLGRFSVTPLGVRDSLLDTPPKRSIKTGRFVLGYIGPLDPNKNLMLILKAAKAVIKNKRFAFDIYGKGSELDNLMQYKIDNSLDNVEFRGFVLEENIKEIYDSFSVFAFLAIGENYSLVVLEAMSRGLPVIINNDSELVESIRKYCFEVKDEHQFVSLLMKLAKDGYDSKLRDAATTYARGLTWSKTAKETYEIYKNLLNK